MTNHELKMYHELAEWFTTLSSPADYEEEADLYHELIQAESDDDIKTLLELGAGTGNNATHLKQHYQMTLTDLSPAMIAESQKQNPDCDHHIGDMRTIRLHQEFDAVFIHDAIDYMTSLDDLKAAIETAAIHCKAGGLIIVVPDFVRETFVEATSYGGHDTPKSMRYLEWTWQPEGETNIYYTEYSYLVRDGLNVHSHHERHIGGLFSKDEWLSVFRELGSSN